MLRIIYYNIISVYHAASELKKKKTRLRYTNQPVVLISMACNVKFTVFTGCLGYHTTLLHISLGLIHTKKPHKQDFNPLGLRFIKRFSSRGTAADLNCA